MNSSRELYRLAKHFPERAISRLRGFYTSKRPSRFALVTAIHDVIRDTGEFKGPDIIFHCEKWIPLDLHKLLLDMAMDPMEHPHQAANVIDLEVSLVMCRLGLKALEPSKPGPQSQAKPGQ